MTNIERWTESLPAPTTWLTVGLLIFGVAACDEDDPSPYQPQTDPSLTEIVGATPSLSTLGAALGSAGLDQTLQGSGPFTVFAPADAAFDALGGDVVASLLEPENAALLESILTYHVVPGGAVESGALSDGQTVTTVQGGDLTIAVDGSTVTVDGATVIQADVQARNGVAHVIDGVLVPGGLDLVDVAVLNGLGTLVDLVRTADLEEVLRGTPTGADGWTVFAPTEEAFAALDAVPEGDALVEVLTYHVVSGTVGSGDLSDGMEVTTVQGATFTVKIDGSTVTLTDGAGSTVTVTATDVPAANGVIHVIDGVILPG